MELLQSGRCIKIAAPMVRFSKLPWRHVVRSYGTEIVYSPMIMADSFVNSQKARDVEFTTNGLDAPLVVQFAAHTDKEFGDAAELLRSGGHTGGIDLNCGCPQKWALQEGIGAALLKQPETIKSMVQSAKSRSGDLPVSIKIRIAKDLRETTQIVKMAESMGVNFITVHGRTSAAKPSDPVDFDAIRTVREHATVPLIANGDVRSLADVDKISKLTGAAGAMAARGLLQNPAMFAGYDVTPDECINDYVHCALSLGTRFEVLQKSLQVIGSIPLVRVACRWDPRLQSTSFSFAKHLLVHPMSCWHGSPADCRHHILSCLFVDIRHQCLMLTCILSQWMMGDVLNKADRIELVSCVSASGVVDFLSSRGLSMTPSKRLLPLK